MKTAYPIVMRKGKNNIIVYIPDFNINTEGKDYADAVEMAKDAICLMCIDMEDDREALPNPTPLYEVKTEIEDDIVALVEVDFSELGSYTS